MAGVHRSQDGIPDLNELALRLAATPCGPLYKSHTFPRDALDALVSAWQPT